MQTHQSSAAPGPQSPRTTGLTRRVRLGLLAVIGFLVLLGASLAMEHVAEAGAEWLTATLGEHGIAALVTATVITGLTLLVLLGLAEVVLRIVHGRRLQDEVHHHFLKYGWLDLALGAAIAAIAIGAVFGIELVAGWLQVESWAWIEVGLGDWLSAAYLAVLTVAAAAVMEEIMVRSCLLSAIAQAWGKSIGLAVMAMCYGLLLAIEGGVGEPGWLASVTLRTLPAMLLGWLFLRTHSPWMPTGLHFAWVILQEHIFNLAGEESAHLFGALTRQEGPLWFVGGKRGMETGAAGILALAIAWALAWWWTRAKAPRAHSD